MGLVDQLLTETEKSRPGPKCALGRLLHTLPDLERDELIAALQHPNISHTVISNHLATRHNLTVDAGMIARHRRGDCTGCRHNGWFTKP